MKTYKKLVIRQNKQTLSMEKKVVQGIEGVIITKLRAREEIAIVQHKNTSRRYRGNSSNVTRGRCGFGVGKRVAPG